MTKEKFAAQLAKEMKTLGYKLTVPSAEKFVTALAKSMAEGLIRDRKLIVSNFGSFESIKVGAKVINSPRGDKKKFFMPPTDIIKWHPSGKIRERAESFEIDDEEFERIKGKPQDEDLPKVFAPEEVVPIIKTQEKASASPFEVKVRYVKKEEGEETVIRHSPISKLVKNLMKEMVAQGANKMTVSPERFATQIVYFAGEEKKLSKTIPRESHNIVVDQVVNLACGEPEFLLFGTDRVRIESKLTPFGTELIIQSVR